MISKGVKALLYSSLFQYPQLEGIQLGFKQSMTSPSVNQ